MFGLTLAEIKKEVNGELIGGSAGLLPVGAAIDSRDIKEGELFFALKGEKADGHDFLAAARDKGAVAAIVSRRPAGLETEDFPLIMVEDVTKALQQTALAMRRLFRGPVAAITGSTGKTTTKDMLSSILSERGTVLKNRGNFNNELGLPLTLLALGREHWAIVLEMGMRGLGEIDFLAWLSEPEYGIITNIGHTHEELLGSADRIAQAKAELISHIPAKGGLVLNYNDKEKLKPWLSNIRSRVDWVGIGSPAELWAEGISESVGTTEPPALSFVIKTKGQGGADIEMPVLGRHNVTNALLAAATARQLGLGWDEISAGLRKVNLTAMRLELIEHKERELVILNDAYNANPDSMAAALEVLASVREGRKAGRAIAVLGDMYELGGYEKKGHLLVGHKVRQARVSLLITVGKLAADIAAGAQESGMAAQAIRVCRDKEEAIACLKESLKPQDTVLIKGSRGVKMEEIVFALLNR